MNYKVVAVTPSGRMGYLKILHKYIIKHKDILDRWDLWINTDNESDIEYMKELSKNDSFIHLVYPTWKYEKNTPNLSISPFWSKATDEDTIYIRFDDDIVFIDENTIKNLVEFRIENKNHLFIYPFIINNPFYSKNLQLRELVSKNHGVIRTYKELSGPGINDPVSLNNSEFARELHETFIESYHKNEHTKFMCNEKIIWEIGDGFYNYGTKGSSEFVSNAGPQVSINCVCWFGETMKKITPINDCYFEGDGFQREYTDEEPYLTIVKTKDLNMPSCTAPNTLVVHFLFGPQRVNDNMTDILEKYKDIANV
jgi:hypothetical protein